MSVIKARTVRARNGQDILIRLATADDASPLMSLSEAVIGEERWSVSQPGDPGFTEEQWRKYLKQHQVQATWLALVAEVEGVLSASVTLQAGERRLLAHVGVLQVQVAVERRGAGVGRALMESLLHWAVENPVLEKVSLSVLADNVDAIALYSSLGFVEEGRRIRALRRGPGDYVDEILMYKWTGGAD